MTVCIRTFGLMIANSNEKIIANPLSCILKQTQLLEITKSLYCILLNATPIFVRSQMVSQHDRYIRICQLAKNNLPFVDFVKHLNFL